jgi:60S ribosome biogenesis protein Rrp14
MPPLQFTNLLRELEEHNSFFDELVDMIPAKLYVAGNSGMFPRK